MEHRKCYLAIYSLGYSQIQTTHYLSGNGLTQQACRVKNKKQSGMTIACLSCGDSGPRQKLGCLETSVFSCQIGQLLQCVL